MCLTTSQKWPKVAWRPITTYKVVYSPDYYPMFITLVQCFPILIGNTYKEALRNIFRSRKKFSKGYEIYCGLHSYTNEDFSKSIARCYEDHDTKVVECIIPRFSLYWIGIDNDIVSNKLKYVKIFS